MGERVARALPPSLRSAFTRVERATDDFEPARMVTAGDDSIVGRRGCTRRAPTCGLGEDCQLVQPKSGCDDHGARMIKTDWTPLPFRRAASWGLADLESLLGRPPEHTHRRASHGTLASAAPSVAAPSLEVSSTAPLGAMCAPEPRSRRRDSDQQAPLWPMSDFAGSPPREKAAAWTTRRPRAEARCVARTSCGPSRARGARGTLTGLCGVAAAVAAAVAPLKPPCQ